MEPLSKECGCRGSGRGGEKKKRDGGRANVWSRPKMGEEDDDLHELLCAHLFSDCIYIISI